MALTQNEILRNIQSELCEAHDLYEFEPWFDSALMSYRIYLANTDLEYAVMPLKYFKRFIPNKNIDSVPISDGPYGDTKSDEAIEELSDINKDNTELLDSIDEGE